eukprot:TRINITY_DN2134_c0_g2_i1.p1 TRINITY_DN2134_c0_g2~~TRINITY_DN2134_c0_g2_i1.p1  ORF type:complete len:290 (-),score=30.41 TRINITY_DN2134_c0_g2_i1:1145-1969(-)
MNVENNVEEPTEVVVSKAARVRTIIMRIVAVLVIMATAFAVVWFAIHPVQLKEGLEWIQGIGWWGNLIFVVCYVAISFPVSIGYTVLAIACGFIYGILIGTATVIVGSMVIGASLAYWINRTLAREWLTKWIKGKEKAELILELVQANGFKIMLLLRLTPVPFGLQNALFPIAGIPFLHYFVATIVGMTPEAIVWCYLGSSTRKLSEIIHGGQKGVWHYVMFGVEIAAAIGLCVILTVVGRRALKKAMEQKKRLKEQHDQLLEKERSSDYSQEW